MLKSPKGTDDFIGKKQINKHVKNTFEFLYRNTLVSLYRTSSVFNAENNKKMLKYLASFQILLIATPADLALG